MSAPTVPAPSVAPAPGRRGEVDGPAQARSSRYSSSSALSPSRPSRSSSSAGATRSGVNRVLGDPGNAGGDGTAALVETLRTHGVQVQLARTQEELTDLRPASSSTVVVISRAAGASKSSTRILRERSRNARRIVLLDPRSEVLAQFGFSASLYRRPVPCLPDGDCTAAGSVRMIVPPHPGLCGSRPAPTRHPMLPALGQPAVAAWRFSLRLRAVRRSSSRRRTGSPTVRFSSTTRPVSPCG